jgi:hypothetical protein|tara:strand:- start:163 stop:1398 length:1236 start_codon:yes stop_codon:yes gene_type:complete
MKIFTYRYLSIALVLTAFTSLALAPALAFSQTSNESPSDSLSMDASYNRPVNGGSGARVAIGGYLEANTFYSSEDGLSEGLSFQARRLTMFMSSKISNRIKFMSEIEFEEGGREIVIEFAAMDIELSPAFNLRGGIVMNPIGSFNQNHDGPNWEFIERPDMAVNMLPATWSNAGFGIYGKMYSGDFIIGYEAYLTNGFNNSIIDNEESRTFLPAAKEDHERFEESFNGRPLFTGKIAIKNRQIGELGFSYMGGVYNKYTDDGVDLDDERRCDVLAVDFSTTIKSTGTHITAEAALIIVDIPETYTEQYGSEQHGAFMDIVQPVFRGKVLDWENSVFNVAARIDYVDWNVGTFESMGTDIGDEVFAITPGLSFRPTNETVLRLNYRYQWQEDILHNPAALTATWMLGFSTYF